MSATAPKVKLDVVVVSNDSHKTPQQVAAEINRRNRLERIKPPPPRTVPPRTVPQSKVMRLGVLAALEAGPATVKEIRQRMGVAPRAPAIAVMLRQLERNGLVKEIARVAGEKYFGREDHPTAPILWALVEKAK